MVRRDLKGRHQSADWCKKCPMDIFCLWKNPCPYAYTRIGAGIRLLVVAVRIVGN